MEKRRGRSGRHYRKGRGETGRRANQDSLIPRYAVGTKAAIRKYFDVVMPRISAHYIIITLFLALFKKMKVI